MNPIAKSLALLLILSGTSACTRHEGPVERAGKKIDDAVDNAKDGENPLHKKGAAEKMGEAVDNTIKDINGQNRP